MVMLDVEDAAHGGDPGSITANVSACIAHDAGVRAEIWTMPVHSRIREVCAPIQAAGVNASEPHASAVHTESYSSRSASCASAIENGFGCAPQ